MHSLQHSITVLLWQEGELLKQVVCPSTVFELVMHFESMTLYSANFQAPYISAWARADPRLRDSLFERISAPFPLAAASRLLLSALTAAIE